AVADTPAAVVRVTSVEDTILDGRPAARGDRAAEVEQTRIRTRAMQLSAFIWRQYPDADAIAIRYAVGFAIPIQGMEVTRLASVFNVNPEQASARNAATRLRLTYPIAHTGEDDLVSGHCARLRHSAAIPRIAVARFRIGDACCSDTVGSNVRAQAGAS